MLSSKSISKPSTGTHVENCIQTSRFGFWINVFFERPSVQIILLSYEIVVMGAAICLNWILSKVDLSSHGTNHCIVARVGGHDLSCYTNTQGLTMILA